ncbi:MAG: hypothetical protein FJ280_24675 [Planctomycetes bacterium]|nr:hypothetical protein [Planctomycetota bacterium]
MTRNAAIRLVAFTRHTVAPSIPDAPTGQKNARPAPPLRTRQRHAPNCLLGLPRCPPEFLRRHI